MKKTQLIEIGILVVALICAFQALDAIIGFFFVFQLVDGFGSLIQPVIPYLIGLACYFAAFALLVRKRRQIAAYIARQGRSDDNQTGEESIPLLLDQQALLYIALVTLCLITLISEIPTLIVWVYNYFKNDVGGIATIFSDNYDFRISIIKLIITVIILFCAKPISNLFGDSDKKVAETKTDSPEHV